MSSANAGSSGASAADRAAGRDPRARRRRAGVVLRVLASLLLSLVAVEVVARVAGLRPKDELAANPNEPILHAPDPLLGWKTVPGSYVIPPYAPQGAPAHVTIWPDGSRATAAKPGASGSELLLVGCSFAFGWPLSDQDTMAWRLQASHPELRIVNRAVKAYGTYQALMLLEQLFAAGERPARVVYGFHQAHEDRNVAAPRWLAMLERFSRTGGITLPYATLGPDGRLERHSPERYPALPLRGALASVAYVEDLLVRPAKLRVLGKRRVTEQLILAMRDLCARYGIRFDVLLLQASAEARSAYARFFARENISYADCVVPIPPELRVPGEGHPGPVINERWTACVEDRLLRSGA